MYIVHVCYHAYVNYFVNRVVSGRGLIELCITELGLYLVLLSMCFYSPFSTALCAGMHILQTFLHIIQVNT